MEDGGAEYDSNNYTIETIDNGDDTTTLKILFDVDVDEALVIKYQTTVNDSAKKTIVRVYNLPTMCRFIMDLTVVRLR